MNFPFNSWQLVSSADNLCKQFGSIPTSGAPRGFGDLGRMAVYFQGAGSTGNYFQGFWEQAHSFGDLGSHAKKLKKSHLKGKAFIWFDFFFQKFFGFWGEATQTPLDI